MDAILFPLGVRSDRSIGSASEIVLYRLDALETHRVLIGAVEPNAVESEVPAEGVADGRFRPMPAPMRKVIRHDQAIAPSFERQTQ
ncbi:hypothetical protein GCM10019060_39880 [Novosphingobium pokkalii]|nr:hypothetical protein GCM10019060_39880 [Novosphingobium pokkalii]